MPVSCASGATCPVNATLQAGSAIAGKFGIDQTTPGTTNGVQTLSGSTTAVTQATAANLNATVVGAGAAGTPSGGVVSVQGVASGTVLPANVSQIGGSAFALGQTTMASSLPVALASNQSSIPVTTVSGSNTVRIQDSGGNTLNGGSYGSDNVSPAALSTLWGTTETTGLNPAGNIDRVRLDRNATGVQLVTTGGISTTAIGAASAGPNVIKGSAGRLAKAVITTVGTTGTDTFYDNASACSGTVLGTVQGTTAVTGNLIGTIVVFDMPAANGITECGGTGSAAVTVSYF